MKVVINACFGGFGISDAAYLKLAEWGIPIQRYIDQEIPDGTDYVIEEYDGNEHIAETHRTWA